MKAAVNLVVFLLLALVLGILWMRVIRCSLSNVGL